MARSGQNLGTNANIALNHLAPLNTEIIILKTCTMDAFLHARNVMQRSTLTEKCYFIKGSVPELLQNTINLEEKTLAMPTDAVHVISHSPAICVFRDTLKKSIVVVCLCAQTVE